MTVKRNTLVVTATAIAYLALFELNSLLFSAFSFSTHVDWIFLPSGLRLVFILVFVEWGAVGVAIGSMLITYFMQSNGNLMESLGAGLISGFAPLLARQLCIDFLKLDAGLRNLSTGSLLKISALFAICSSLLHQLWFTWLGQTTHFIHSTVAMAVGDLLGTVIVLYTSKFVLTTLLPSVGTRSP
jgi:hypothetical protein